MKDDDMDEAYTTHRRDEKYIQNFVLKTWREQPLGRPRRIWEVVVVVVVV